MSLHPKLLWSAELSSITLQVILQSTKISWKRKGWNFAHFHVCNRLPGTINTLPFLKIKRFSQLFGFSDILRYSENHLGQVGKSIILFSKSCVQHRSFKLSPFSTLQELKHVPTLVPLQSNSTGHRELLNILLAARDSTLIMFTPLKFAVSNPRLVPERSAWISQPRNLQTLLFLNPFQSFQFNLFKLSPHCQRAGESLALSNRHFCVNTAATQCAKISASKSPNKLNKPGNH